MKRLNATIAFDLKNEYGIVELNYWPQPGTGGSSVTVRGDPGNLHSGIRQAIIEFSGLSADYGNTALGNAGYSFTICGKEYTLPYTNCVGHTQIKQHIQSVIDCCADACQRLSTKGESSFTLL